MGRPAYAGPPYPQLGDTMIETTRGLPNTCHDCGKPAGPTWWAEHEDAARAGGGVCRVCAVKRGWLPPEDKEPERAASTQRKRTRRKGA